LVIKSLQFDFNQFSAACRVARACWKMKPFGSNCLRSSTGFGNSFFKVVYSYLRLLIHKVQTPFSTNTHFGRHRDDVRGKLFQFNQQSMRFNVRFTSTTPRTAILITDAVGGFISSPFCRWRRHAWFYISVNVVRCIFILLANTQNSTG